MTKEEALYELLQWVAANGMPERDSVIIITAGKEWTYDDITELILS